MNVVHTILKEEAKREVSTVAYDGRDPEVVRVAENPVWNLVNLLRFTCFTWYYLKQKKLAGSKRVFLSPGRRRA